VRLIALVMNVALLGAFIAILIEYGDGTWRAQEYVVAFLVCGATLSSLGYLLLVSKEPWLSFRRALKADK
jgi:hypothetical protein